MRGFYNLFFAGGEKQSSVALGHPIGASGCRLLVTLIHAMIRQNQKTGLVSLCLGGGEAVALVVRR